MAHSSLDKSDCVCIVYPTLLEFHHRRGRRRTLQLMDRRPCLPRHRGPPPSHRMNFKRHGCFPGFSFHFSPR